MHGVLAIIEEEAGVLRELLALSRELSSLAAPEEGALTIALERRDLLLGRLEELEKAGVTARGGRALSPEETVFAADLKALGDEVAEEEKKASDHLAARLTALRAESASLEKGRTVMLGYLGAQSSRSRFTDKIG